MKRNKFVIEKVLTAIIAFITIVTFSVRKTSVAISKGNSNIQENIQKSTEPKVLDNEKEIEKITESDTSNLKKLIKLIKKIDSATRENDSEVNNSEDNSRS